MLPRGRNGMHIPRLLNVQLENFARTPLARSATLSSHDQIHSLRSFALFIGFDVEADLLTFVQTFKSGLLHGGDVHEHVASAIVRFYKAVAAFAVEEFYNASLRHRETPSPRTALPPAPRHGGSAQHSQSGNA